MRHFWTGSTVTMVGVVLWLTTQDLNTPVVALSTVGIVLAVLGFAGMMWGVWTMVKPRRKRPRGSR